MNSIEATLLVQDAEASLQAWCAQRGVEYHTVRRELFRLWRAEDAAVAYQAQREKEAPLEAILQQARNRLADGNRAGYRQACLDWLQAKHGAALGDTVQLFGWAKPRTVKLTDFSIQFDSYGGFAWYEGPCLSHRIRNSIPTSHGQGLEVRVVKLN